MTADDERRRRARERTRAYRARRYADGWHYIRGGLTKAPRRRLRNGEEPPHGTTSRYTGRWRCRCDLCRAANTEAARQRRTAARERREQHPPTMQAVTELDEFAPTVTVDDDWKRHAECHGLTSLMFTGRGESVEEAKAVCAGCPVRVQCLEFALDNGEKFGVWGGLSERERRRLRRRAAA